LTVSHDYGQNASNEGESDFVTQTKDKKRLRSSLEHCNFENDILGHNHKILSNIRTVPPSPISHISNLVSKSRPICPRRLNKRISRIKSKELHLPPLHLGLRESDSDLTSPLESSASFLNSLDNTRAKRTLYSKNQRRNLGKNNKPESDHEKDYDNDDDFLSEGNEEVVDNGKRKYLYLSSLQRSDSSFLCPDIISEKSQDDAFCQFHVEL